MQEVKAAKILVVDDEEMIRFAFEEFLKDEGHVPLLASNAEAALTHIKESNPEIVFLDYRLPERDGLDLLEEIRRVNSKLAVVFMTAFGAMDVAIRAMQLGAYEYLTKPLDLDRIRILIQRILDAKKSLESMERSVGQEVPASTLDKMVGQGQAMQEIFKMIGLLTVQDVTVLITGESGVGKELVARAIHENSSRSKHTFVAVNCGAMPETLLEAEMFGYEKGAFTGASSQKQGKFEVAGEGTIFLDEIGELPLALQVKLLRVLQEKSVERVGGNKTIRTDARVIAATNKDLKEEVLFGRFRKDLYYRLHLIHIHLPPLRERTEDIPLLIGHFIRKANLETGREVKGVADEAMNRLLSYPWPGNIRELENEIKRAIVLSREDILPEYLFELQADDLPGREESMEDRLSTVTKEYFSRALKDPASSDSIYSEVIGVIEKALIQEALLRAGGNQLQAAALLGMNRSTLRKKLREHGLF
jgi:DNA-binding NtrC family response regulator